MNAAQRRMVTEFLAFLTVTAVVVPIVFAIVTAMHPTTASARDETEYITVLHGGMDLMVYRDNVHAVTCWSTGHGVSCLPDQWLDGRRSPMNFTTMLPPRYKAYLVASIDTQTGKIVEVRIYSADKGGLTGRKGIAYADLHWTWSDVDFQCALDRMNEEIDSPLCNLQWVRPWFRG